MASKRINKELKDLQKDPPTSCSAGVLQNQSLPSEHQQQPEYLPRHSEGVVEPCSLHLKGASFDMLVAFRPEPYKHDRQSTRALLDPGPRRTPWVRAKLTSGPEESNPGLCWCHASW